MSQDFEATIRADSERAEVWRKIMGSETVYIKSFIPSAVSLPGVGETTAYQLDIALLTTEQRRRLVVHLAERFGYSPSNVERDLDTIGCPILADDIVVTVRNPQRWIDMAADDCGDGTGDFDQDWDDDDFDEWAFDEWNDDPDDDDDLDLDDDFYDFDEAGYPV